MVFDYVKFPEVDGSKLLSSLEDTANGLGWAYKKSQVPGDALGTTRFEFGLGESLVYNAWIAPSIADGRKNGGEYSSIEIRTNKLIPDENCKSHIEDFARLFQVAIELPEKKPINHLSVNH